VLGAFAAGPAGTLGSWLARDDGSNAGPSRWEIRADGTPPSRYVAQTSHVWGGSVAGNDPVKPGTVLLRAGDPTLPASHPEQPRNWTDYRFSVVLRSEGDDALGVVFRHQDAKHFYRFSLDRQRRYRRLVRVVGGVHTVLAEDGFVYRAHQDYLITVEAIGSSLRVYQDGALAFEATDSSLDAGSVGLYCWNNATARFADLRVDDFRALAPVVYRFRFTTSRFTDFFHHVHSFQDQTWLKTTMPLDSAIGSMVTAATASPGRPSEVETRAYDALVALVPNRSGANSPPELQVTRLERGTEALAFLVESPEPIDWTRTDVSLSYAAGGAVRPDLPGAVKLTSAAFADTEPNDESLSLLLREPTDLSRYRLEYRRLGDPLTEPSGDPLLFTDDFEGAPAGHLLDEDFGPNALDRYTIVNDGTNFGPSDWSAATGRLVQSSLIFGGSISAAVPDKPGTMALTGAASWANVRVRVMLHSNDEGAIGVVFRYRDRLNYYRFSMDRARSYRRLVKKVDGEVSVLWEDSRAYHLGHYYVLELAAQADRLVGYLDDVLLFSVRDADLASGQVGLYSWLNDAASFDAVSVEALEGALVLWQPAFADLAELEVVDEAGATDGPSAWSTAGGDLTQSANIHVEDAGPHKPGTYALGGRAEWQDVQISAHLRSDDDAHAGLMFRYQDRDNYYRFSIGPQPAAVDALFDPIARVYRRLIKKRGGVVTVLWQDSVPSSGDPRRDLTLRVVGAELQGHVDGVRLFTVYDGGLKRGRVGFYCASNRAARFSRVVVLDRTRRVGDWTVHDEGTVNAPSEWRLGGGALIQATSIDGDADPGRPGTYVVAGQSAWRDYRAVVRLRSDTGQAIGVLFRYVDSDNYYRLSLDGVHGYRRLISKTSGVVTTLWEDAGGYGAGDELTLTIDAVGSRLAGYVGDARLFTVADGAHPAGKVGLYCAGNAGARFESVEVSRPPLAAHALFRDRFDGGDAGAWSFVADGSASGPPAWAIHDRALRQTSDIYTPPDDRDTLDKRGTQAVAGDPTWTDVAVDVQLRSLDDDAIGVLFRHADSDHYYRFSMDSQRGYRRLVKNVGGTFTRLWEDTAGYVIGRAYRVTIVAVGHTLRGYLDGVPMFVVEDDDLPAGRIGLYCWANTDARFSNVRVYPADQAFGNWQFEDRFAALVRDRWTIVDGGDQQGPSAWDVVDGELRQTSNIYAGPLDASVPDKPGTIALAGDPSWTDYRVSVQLRSDDDDAIGVLFRYTDPDHYYRFSMDRERSYRRLIKRVGGTSTVVWEDAVPYEMGRAYVLTLECLGEQLAGYLDGEPLFRVADRALATGRIGLYCWANTGARFGGVRVAAPTWATYYSFPREARLPAGTRVRVFAGNAADAGTAERGVVRRFAAPLDERGRPCLPASGAHVRVRAPGIAVGHMRRFLPDSAYAPVAARLLRKVDGTGMFIVVPSAVGTTRLTPGQYRLHMTYRRDNVAVEPTSQVFTEAGDSTPEQANIDIVWDARS
jgi:hypothetical protein